MATKEYDKNNTTRINLKLNNKTDADIIEKLEKCRNVQGYIKAMIREDIREEQMKVKKTVYIVYGGSVEIKSGSTYNEYAIQDDNDPKVLLETENKDEAVEYAISKQPKMDIRKNMGMAVKFDVLRGIWVEEEIRTYDKDGDVADVEDMGTWFVSELPDD